MLVERVSFIQCAVSEGAAVAEPGVSRDPSAEEMGHARAVTRQEHRAARLVLAGLWKRRRFRNAEESTFDLTTNLVARRFGYIFRHGCKV